MILGKRKKRHKFYFQSSFIDLITKILEHGPVKRAEGDLCKDKVILPWHRLTTAYTIQFEPINLVPWNVKGFACSTTLAVANAEFLQEKYNTEAAIGLNCTKLLLTGD